ncbi:MAG: flagellar biosynthesis protein FlhF [Leptospiraceae bacterium]|nr:flagellar biosynthesis protein FlhF [Leptospiraceae bacterium]
MDFVKIKGKDIQDCFMQMKMKYGPEAHVYNQRVVVEGGLMGTKLMSKKFYEIEIGIPEQQTSKDRVEKKLQDLKELLRQKSDDDTRKKSLHDLKPIVTEERAFAGIRPIEKDEPNLTTEMSSVINRNNLGLSIKDEIGKKENAKSITTGTDSSYLKRLKDRLISEGMTNDYLQDLISKTDKHLSVVDKEKPSAVNEKFAEIIEDRISIDSDLFSGTGRGKRKVIFFVGPTGSGKTTTIAKLAAKYFLHMGRMVSLYTTDNYKIAAVEQLKRYADTMDIPFYAVKDVKRLQEQLLRDGSELILVDTPGYNHKNQDFLNKIKQYRDAFGDKDQIENILVIPATSSYSNLKSVIGAYESTGYKRLILTKIDEADYVSSVLELADISNKVFAYFSLGQEVPFDIISASKKSFSEIVVNPDKIKELKGDMVVSG